MIEDQKQDKTKKSDKKELLKTYEKYFSKDYFEAKQKFLVATKIKKLKLYSKKIKNRLTIDVAFHNSGKKDKLLIVISGVHGVEGYTGSAFQLLFLDKYFEKIKKDFSVLLIHAYNPCGFVEGRRVNENNVDLNRNCLEEFKLGEQQQKILSIIKNSKKLFSPEKARGNNLMENQKQNLIMLKILMKNGIKKTILAGVSGQNLYPLGAGYIGNKKETSTLFFQKLLKKEASKYKTTLFLDIHTGLGKKFELSTYTYNKPDSEEVRFLKKINKKTKSTKGGRTIPHSGSLGYYFLNHALSERKIHLLLEFGTVSRVSGGLSLSKLSKINVAENQITNFGPSRKLEKIRKKMKKAYYPGTKKFKLIVIMKSKRILDRLCEEYGEI